MEELTVADVGEGDLEEGDEGLEEVFEKVCNRLVAPPPPLTSVSPI